MNLSHGFGAHFEELTQCGCKRAQVHGMGDLVTLLAGRTPSLVTWGRLGNLSH